MPLFGTHGRGHRSIVKNFNFDVEAAWQVLGSRTGTPPKAVLQLCGVPRGAVGEGFGSMEKA